MNNKKLLVASSSKNEAVTQWILNNQLLTPNVDVLFIGDLLNNYDIKDRIDNKKIRIQWCANNLCKYSNDTHYLLNRVTHIEKKLFENFHKDDREYAQREFEAYLGFAFNSFERVQNCSINGICERINSLPQQWNLVKKITDLSIPSYYWGSKSYSPFAPNLPVVHSSIYNFLNWSDTCTAPLTGFCFEKPQGVPVFILSIGKNRLITTEKQLTSIKSRQIAIIMDKIKVLVPYFIFECLLFVAEESITFGCVNIDLVRSQQNPLFSHFLEEYLVQEFNKCLN